MTHATQSVTTSIQDELSDDHRRLNELFDRLVAAVWEGSRGAAAIAAEFDEGLTRHIRWEEDHLFPAVQADVPRDLRRHIESLQADHELLLELTSGMRAELKRRDFDGAKALIEEFTYHLAGHNDDEELGIYRDADRNLRPEARRELIARFRATEKRP
jgi:regulator of cell morphogenesis and NO signaling